MKKTVVYPGTFDPITNGHVDVIQRAAGLFDQVVVAVAPTRRKSPCFTVDERVALITTVLASHENVKVFVLDGLLVDFAKHHRAQAIVRGLRAVSDFDYEFQLAHMNHRLAPEIETIFLPGSEGCAFISGTMVREIVALGGDVSAFVPPVVATRLRDLKKIKE